MKRAQLFDISMTFVVIGAMIAIALVGDKIATETSPLEGIGQRAFELQNAYAQGDYFVNFMASAARWAASDALLELGKNGGLGKAATCGKSNGFSLWNAKNAKTQCFPNAYESFYELLGEKMKQYGIPKMPRIPYEFVVSGNHVLGIATAPVRIDIRTPEEAYVLTQWSWLDATIIFGAARTTYVHDAHTTGSYFFRPNFEIPFTYDLDVYKTLAQSARAIVQKCSLKTAVDAKKSCAEFELISLSNVNVANDPDDKGLFYFTINQEDEKSIYTNNVAPIIKFGLYIPTIVPPAPQQTPSVAIQAGGGAGSASTPSTGVGGGAGGAAPVQQQAAQGP